MGLFAQWQPHYAEHGIATFPVRGKQPRIKGYLQLGLSGSAKLVSKFSDADTFGFACAPSGITVLDVDTSDEGLFADALAEFGATPLLVRSGSGHYQAWYRRNGEGRKIRPDPSRPIDVLGGGYIVAPPSEGRLRSYEIIEGSLDDLPRLPVIRSARLQVGAADRPVVADIGMRNDTLWRQCMRAAGGMSSFEEMLEYAEALNSRFTPPLPPGEVVRTARSAWKKESDGTNWFGSGERVGFTHPQIDRFLEEQHDAFLLFAKLRREHWWREEFYVANEMAATMKWPRKRFAAARTYLEAIGEIEMIRPPSAKNGPAIYRFKSGRI